MKKSILIFVVLTALVLPFAAHAQSLDQLVQQLQEKPGDSALREQIIKQAQAEKAAIPEEARGYFVEGSALAKAAENEKGQKLAVESFEKALEIAPWWGDAYYNLAIAQELAGQFGDAQSSLNLYILSSPGEQEARAAQDKIYELNAKKKLAENKKEEKAIVSAARKAEIAEPQKEKVDNVKCGRQIDYPAGIFEKGYERQGNEVLAFTSLVKITNPSELGWMTREGEKNIDGRFVLAGNQFTNDYGSTGMFSDDGRSLTIDGYTYSCTELTH